MTKFKKCDVKKCNFTYNYILFFKCHDCHEKHRIRICSICADHYGIRVISELESFSGGQGDIHTVTANFKIDELMLDKFWKDTGIT